MRSPRLRVVLFGDGESPHLLKWAQALMPRVELHVASSRGLSPALAALVAPERTLVLGHDTKFAGGNVTLLKSLPRLLRWLRGVDADWISAHYLTSHGTLAWLSRQFGVRAQLAASAWGSDILVTPERSRLLRWVTMRVLRDAAISTSDSAWMAQRMKVLGAGEIMTFPFGLERLPPVPAEKTPDLFYANRALEPNYEPMRVLDVFERLAASRPQAKLIVANDGSLRQAMEQRVAGSELNGRVSFVGRLSADRQDDVYARSSWYLSLPLSDSVSVSVLEAMAHGCVPILSDLPANRELVDDGRNGFILARDEVPQPERLLPLSGRMVEVAEQSRAWVAENALFPLFAQKYVDRLEALTPGRAREGS